MRRVLRFLREVPGWHTNKKIVVIESDDWGAVRMPSINVWNKLNRAGIKVDDPFARNDSLATPEDLSQLFEVLLSVRDCMHNPAVITANTIMTNPNFEAISSAGFNEYFGESFKETLCKNKKTENSFLFWKEGMNQKVFYPQYHGREHLNILQWMHLLKEGDKEARTAFDYGVYGVNFKNKVSKRANLMATMDFETKEEEKAIIKNAVEGLQLFNKTFDYYSKSFIAPAYVWSSGIEKAISTFGVRYIQGISVQSVPNPMKEKYIRKYNYTGKNNRFGQRYLVRNCFFEPTVNPALDWVGNCLKRMEFIFKIKKPVIIGSHRLNYIGSINSENRKNNLKLLNELLLKIVAKWPDVIFTTSDQLIK